MRHAKSIPASAEEPEPLTLDLVARLLPRRKPFHVTLTSALAASTPLTSELLLDAEVRWFLTLFALHAPVSRSTSRRRRSVPAPVVCRRSPRWRVQGHRSGHSARQLSHAVIRQ